MTVTAVVLAAGHSRRLGRAKQTLPYRGATLLDAALTTARSASVDQVVVTLGGSADEVADQVDLHGVDVVRVDESGEGCAASVRAAVAALSPDSAGLVVLLGDQPGVRATAVDTLVSRCLPRGPDAVGVCRYDDGWGHPLWFGRSSYPALSELHGDKAVWKVLDRAAAPVVVRLPGPVPADVDTVEDYEALVRAEAQGAG
jgi:molybdenum cofactor cytidylyltransferase